MPDLKSLRLMPVYDSAEHDLINDLIVPLLSNSVMYCRGVGYFSSGWLRMAARGLHKLIEAGGKAKLISSPLLAEEDWHAIVYGYRARENKALHDSLGCIVAELADCFEKETLNTFAWMIAENLLDLRFAVPRPGHREGDYHDKVAYFHDSYGNRVAIHGSFNDSVKGTLNGEAFSVFCSWNSGQQPFVERHVSRLDCLWRGENTQFYAFELPEAIRRQIVKLRTTAEPPYRKLSLKVTIPESSPAIPGDIELHDYQKEAIRKWQSKKCCGILEMATGSGKTITALSAVIEELNRRKTMVTIIAVPYIHLLHQWKEACERFGLSPVLCGSSEGNWRLKLRSAVSDFRLSGRPLCVIAVSHTAAIEAFGSSFSKIPADKKLLIADEVHGLGAYKLRHVMQESYALRLGLSATPRRWYDDVGTNYIFEYFGNICYEFSLYDAIKRQFLVPYRYEPRLVSLAESEEHAVADLSASIAKLYAKKKAKGLTEPEQVVLEKAMRDRAFVVKRASMKLQVLRQLIAELRIAGDNLCHSLFYSPEGQHKEILYLLKDESIMARQFIGEDHSEDRKKVLRAFDEGQITALVAMKCLDEGVDVPSTRQAFFIASTTNPKEFIQRRGRVLRRHEGKTHAIIYDFVVVPSEDTPPSVANYLLEREMPRFAEFSDLAENAFSARSKLRPMLDRYGLLHFLDMKPWDVYHRQNPDKWDEMR